MEWPFFIIFGLGMLISSLLVITRRNVVHAALTCIHAGCHGITAHPRPDGRHIRYQDIVDLAALLVNLTNIEFNIEQAGNVQVVIYDILGNYVNTLTSKYYVAGEHDVQWNGTNNSNVDVPSGVYIYQLTHNVGTITKKMILLR